MSNLLNTLNDVISSVNDDKPIIVLGDFIEDILKNDKSVLVQFMRNNGFCQFVWNATTDRGTMIDLLFARNLEYTYAVDSYDIYYSDHDAVYCVLNFNND